MVLGQMQKYGKITKAQYDSLKMLPLGLCFKKEDHKEGYATYFREYLRIYMTAGKPEKVITVGIRSNITRILWLGSAIRCMDGVKKLKIGWYTI